MAKQPAPVPPAPNLEEIANSHPLLRSALKSDELTERLRARKEEGEFKIEELEKWKLCVNGMASTENGQLFLKSMLQHSGIFAPASVRDTSRSIEAGIRAAFYMKCVRPFLNSKLREAIE